MTEITVTAIQHLWRVNFETPYGGVAAVQGYGETVLTETIQVLPIEGIAPKTGSGGGYYGLPEGIPVQRNVSAVAAETVTTSAGEIAFGTIAEALPLFFSRWAQEDKAVSLAATEGSGEGSATRVASGSAMSAPTEGRSEGDALP